MPGNTLFHLYARNTVIVYNIPSDISSCKAIGDSISYRISLCTTLLQRKPFSYIMDRKVKLLLGDRNRLLARLRLGLSKVSHI